MVAVFHSVHGRLGHSCLESFKALSGQVLLLNQLRDLLHRLSLVAPHAGKEKLTERAPVLMIPVFGTLGAARFTWIQRLQARLLVAPQRDQRHIILLLPALAWEGGQFGQQEIDHGYTREVFAEQFPEM